jgi:hypothetical protein
LTTGCADPESFSAPATARIGAAAAGAKVIGDNVPSTMAHETIFNDFIGTLLLHCRIAITARHAQHSLQLIRELDRQRLFGSIVLTG